MEKINIFCKYIVIIKKNKLQKQYEMLYFITVLSVHDTSDNLQRN